MPSHYINHCWVIVIWTLRNKLQWNSYQNTNFSFPKMHFKKHCLRNAGLLSSGRLRDCIYCSANRALCARSILNTQVIKHKYLIDYYVCILGSMTISVYWINIKSSCFNQLISQLGSAIILSTNDNTTGVFFWVEYIAVIMKNASLLYADTHPNVQVPVSPSLRQDICYLDSSCGLWEVVRPIYC